MKNIIKELIEYNEEQKELLLNLDKKNLDKQLNVKLSNGKYYYSILDESISNNFIATDDEGQIREIANNNFETKLYKVLLQRILIVNKFINKLEKLELSAVYDGLHPGRKIKVDPIEASYEVMLEKWIKEEYIPLNYPVELDLESKNGEFMRSKSELILADLFHDYNIKYKYEKELNLKNKVTVYPDFTSLEKI